MRTPRALGRRIGALEPASDRVVAAAFAAFHSQDLLLTPTSYQEGQQALRLIRRAIHNGCRADASLHDFDAATDLIAELGLPVPPIDDRLYDLLAQCERVIRPTVFD